MRPFRVFRRYRGAPFQLSYSLILVKDKLIPSFNKHLRSPGFVEESVTQGVSNKLSDCKFNSKCNANICYTKKPWVNAGQNQGILLEDPFMIYPKSYWVLRGKETLGLSWRNELFWVIGPVQKEKDVWVDFFNAKQESSITADALHHLSARLRKGGGPLNSAWRLLQLHWHRCPDSFSPRQQLPSLPSNIWVYLNTFRMYVLCKHTIWNRRNLWSWV